MPDKSISPSIPRLGGMMIAEKICSYIDPLRKD